MHCKSIFKFISESHIGLHKMNSGKIMTQSYKSSLFLITELADLADPEAVLL